MTNISEFTGPIITNFTGLVGIWVGMTIPIFVRRLHKGRCYGNQLNLGAVCKRCQEGPLLFAPEFDNVCDNCEAAFKRLNGINWATLYAN